MAINNRRPAKLFPTILPSPDNRLTLTLAAGIATLAIDNGGKRNAFDLAMWQALPALTAAVAKSDASILVLRGASDLPFASGADVSEFATVRADAKGGRAYEAANEEAFLAISALAIPTLAVIRRWCLGGGMGLALACDLRIASDDTQFGIPAGRLGVGYPPGAMAMLVSVLGPTLAKDLFFTARRVDAAEALQRGLVQHVVVDDELDMASMSLAQTIAANAPLTLRAAKAAINAAAQGGDAKALPHIRKLAEACFDSADYAEGRSAFLEKREPRFTGR
jgi:enoyl-CoA hydratase/carnithine racemase